VIARAGFASLPEQPKRAALTVKTTRSDPPAAAFLRVATNGILFEAVQARGVE